MICERCRIAGDLNNQLNDFLMQLETRETHAKDESRLANLRESITYNHDHCKTHTKDCMCQHRLGEYVARGFKAEQVSSPAGDGHTPAEN